MSKQLVDGYGRPVFVRPVRATRQSRGLSYFVRPERKTNTIDSPAVMPESQRQAQWNDGSV